jgi:hypothetical protein
MVKKKHTPISIKMTDVDCRNLIVLVMETQFTKKEFHIRSMKTNRNRVSLTALFFALILVVSGTVDLLGQSNEPPTGEIAPELVGKWCFINLSTNTADAITHSCFTLNSDGTFEAVLDRKMLPNANAFSNLQDSDDGTWWVSNNRIFFKSTSNGQGSFPFQKMNHPRLENTPMITIEGVAFATASSHEPW